MKVEPIAINISGVQLRQDNLAHRIQTQLDKFKIDTNLLEIDKDENADKLISSIISIAHGLGLEVVAEGVEERHQVDHLTALGCEYLQGYYFSRPVPHGEVEGLLQNQPMVATG